MADVGNRFAVTLMKARLKTKLQDKLSVSTKLSLKELIANSRRTAASLGGAPFLLARRFFDRLNRAGVPVPAFLKSTTYAHPTPPLEIEQLLSELAAAKARQPLG